MLFIDKPNLDKDTIDLLNDIFECADSAITEINGNNLANAGILQQWIIDIRGELYKREEKLCPT